MQTPSPREEPGPPPLYLPFEAGPWRMTMGLLARPIGALIEIDSDYLEQMALRRRLLATRHEEVFAALPCSAPARQALLAFLGRHLPEHHPAWFGRRGSTLCNRLTGETWALDALGADPLETAGRLVQEDLCLIEPEPAGPRLTAAVLCFPTRWSLAAKLGRPLSAVHEPVPFYAERLAAPVDRFMALLKPGRLVERLNWSIHDNPALFQPAGHGLTAPSPGVTAENAGVKLWLRVERQTLSRIPDVGTILFTIKIYRRTLEDIVRLPGVAARLGKAVRALPEETARYQSVARFRPALLDYLDTLVADFRGVDAPDAAG